uniref:Uncharacterized protein n=1 Tax=Arundo donax TaxID=35708 RepID=A0A0A9FEL0_ARUDO
MASNGTISIPLSRDKQIRRHQIKLVHQRHPFVKLGEEDRTKKTTTKLYQIKTHACIGMHTHVRTIVAMRPCLPFLSSSSSSGRGRRLTAGSRRRTRPRRPQARR